MYNNNYNDNDNERIVWNFTLGIPINTHNDKNNINNEMNNEINFKNAIIEITDEITKLSGGLTYNYSYGTWDSSDKNSIYNNNKCEYNDNAIIERNLNCVISIIIYKEHSTKLYDNIKLIIQTMNNKYKLGMKYIQVIKNIGTAHHFII